MAGGKVVLVTGVSRDLGRRCARAIAEDPSVRRVIGVDVAPPRGDVGGNEHARAAVAELRERLGASRKIGEELVAVVMEVANERHIHVQRQQAVADMRHGLRGGLVVDRDTHDLRSRACELGDLHRRGEHISSIGIGHRLHDDGRAGAHRDVAYRNRHRAVAPRDLNHRPCPNSLPATRRRAA